MRRWNVRKVGLATTERYAPVLLQSLEQGRRDLEIVARLDAIRAEAALSDKSMNNLPTDEAYAEAFLSHGLG